MLTVALCSRIAVLSSFLPFDANKVGKLLVQINIAIEFDDNDDCSKVFSSSLELVRMAHLTNSCIEWDCRCTLSSTIK